MPKDSFRTQKAKGLQTLKGHRLPVPFSQLSFNVYDDPQDIIDNEGISSYHEMFARPCPLPHATGLLHFRIVTSVTEAIGVLNEAKAADPMAEMILMPVIEAKCSAVWTPGSLTIGEGNDGATAGINTRTMEVTGDLTTDEVRKEAGIIHSPYMEFVYGTRWGVGRPETYSFS